MSCLTSSPPEVISVWYQEKAGQETVRNSAPRSHFNASECGACPRRLCYAMAGTPGIHGMGGFLLGRIGKHLHVGVEKDFQEAFRDDVEIEIPIAFTATAMVNGHLHSFVIRERIDLYLKRHKWLADIKTMSSDSWRAFCSGGLRARSWFMHYYEQMNLYALGMSMQRQEDVERLWIIPVDRSTGDVFLDSSTSYPVDPTCLGEVWSRWALVQNCLEGSSKPPRPYKKQSVECHMMCGYTKMCWEDSQ